MLLTPRAGFIAAGEELSWSSERCQTLRRELDLTRSMLNITDPDTPTPVGIGCLTMNCEHWIDDLLQLVQMYKPVAVWLFANATRQQHTVLIRELKKAGTGWGLKTFVQVGNVHSARMALEDDVDVLVAQGSDAGGHQFVHGASLLVLLPELRDLLAREYSQKAVPLLAAGGIIDGRSIAAALILGG